MSAAVELIAAASKSRLKEASVETRTSSIANGGKGLFIKQAVGEGEEIWAQRRPMGTALDPDQLSIVCSNCFGQVHDVTKGWSEGQKPIEVKACTGCQVLRFCSRECQAATWKWHKHTCKYWSKITSQDDRDMVLNPLYRMLVQLLAMRKSGLIKEPQWADVLEMEGADLALRDDSERTDILIAFFAVDTIMGAKVDMDYAKKLLPMLKRNTFTLVANTYDPLGAAFDPTVCRMNHSCRPNCYVSFDGARISIRSLTKLDSGQEMTISYIDASYPVRQRQQELKERYYFTCTCPLCTSITNTWQDAFPFLTNMPDSFKKTLKITSNDTNTALEGKAMRLLAGFTTLSSAPVSERIAYLESIESFFIASQCWPIYRQGRAEMLDNLLLLYIGAQRYADATKIAVSLYLLVVPVHYPEPHHPLAITQCLRLTQLLTNIGFESGHQLPFDVMLVLWELARRAVDGARRSHGEQSTLYRAICERFALEVLNMAKSMTGMSRKDVELKVLEELEKMKIWAAGEEQLSIAEKSLASTRLSP